jgi:minor extracellular serine protease Vpr
MQMAGNRWMIAIRPAVGWICVCGFVLDLCGQTPRISAGEVVNAGSLLSEAASVGSIVSIFGEGLADDTGSASAFPLPTSMAGAQVMIGGFAAPLFFVSSTQINAQVPWELVGETQAVVTATVDGQTSAPETVQIAPFGPGIFSVNGQGAGQGAILDPSYRLVDSSNPATAGATVIQIYCTGLGAVTNQPPSGSPAASSPLSVTAPPAVTIGGAPAPVLFSGLAPGFVGLYQVNAQVPAGAPSGNAIPVVISVGGVASNTVTIAVAGASGSSQNPQPAIASLSPSVASSGSGALTLTISGSGFIPSSSVTFKGALRTPTFVNSG